MNLIIINITIVIFIVQRSNTEILTLVLAGGEGIRLMPLTKKRCKPAIMFGGRYRLIDIPISNALNANFREIYILSQFLADTLACYIHETYPINESHVEILTPKKGDAYEGTADAVRKNLSLLRHFPGEYVLILSGDQLYSMDLDEMLQQAKKTGASLTVATMPVSSIECRRMGVMKLGENFKITSFYEKPDREDLIREYAIAPKIAEKYNSSNDLTLLASLGIYIFKKDYLIQLLTEFNGNDFGKDLIPIAVDQGKTFSYIFNGYWEDIGTIESFYNANLKLINQNDLSLNLYNKEHPIHTLGIKLPSPRIYKTQVNHAIICDGSIIRAKSLTNSMIGMRSEIDEDTVIKNSIIMGNTPEINTACSHIGKHCYIENAIIDEGATLGDNVSLQNKNGLKEYTDKYVTIKNGLIIVPGGTNIPSSYKI